MTNAPVSPFQPRADETRRHSPLPWVYRPLKFDDWGFIRGPKEPGDFAGPIVAIARGETSETFDAHRAAGTDPYGPNAAFIVEAVNSHASLKARIQELEGALRELQALYRAEHAKLGAMQADPAISQMSRNWQGGKVNGLGDARVIFERAALEAKPAGETGNE